MLEDYPKTLEEARAYRYNQWAGNPKGWPYQGGRCAYEVWRNILGYQCSRKNGHGPSGLYCKQHAKKLNT
uniref:Uncharacterized protein n=1 Tax=viral metagenome TaxID=1070528 RepID=A0A6H2A3R7_9ZZZZ